MQHAPSTMYDSCGSSQVHTLFALPLRQAYTKAVQLEPSDASLAKQLEKVRAVTGVL